MIGTCDHCEMPRKNLKPVVRTDELDSDPKFPWQVCHPCRTALPDIFKSV